MFSKNRVIYRFMLIARPDYHCPPSKEVLINVFPRKIAAKLVAKVHGPLFETGESGDLVITVWPSVADR